MTELKLKTNSIKTIDIVVDASNFKGLVISDLHIGYQHPKIDSMNALMPHLRQLVNDVAPTHVFILGDIIHILPISLPYHFNTFFRMLESLGLQVHIIPGNHERYNRTYVNLFKINSKTVFFHNCELMRIIPSTNTRKVVMGHDLKNDLKVHGNTYVRRWFELLRNQFNDVIEHDSLMILGHLHEIVHSEDRLTISVLPYSYDYNMYCYGILEANGDGVLEFQSYEQSIN